MTGFGQWVIAHRRWVSGFWLVMVVAGGLAAPRTIERLGYDVALPGEPAYETSRRIAAAYGGGGDVPPVVLLVRGPDAARAATEVAHRSTAALPGTRAALPGDPGGSGLLSSDGRTALALLFPPSVPGPDALTRARPVVERIAARSSGHGTRIRVLDYDSVAEGGSGGDDRGVLAEVLIGAVGGLVVLLLVFASVLALVPLVVAACSILSTFLVLLGLTYLTDVSFIVQYLVALIGLGVALDFSLLIAMRWREELARGHDGPAATLAALRTAGRSVLFSGLTVAVSLAALVAIPVPFLRSVGLAGLLIPLLSVVTVLTLLPAILRTGGPRLLWPRRHARSPRSRFWEGTARVTLRHRRLCASGATVVLLLMAVPATRIHLGSAPLDSVAAGPDRAAVRDIEAAGLPLGALRPDDVLVPAAHQPNVVDRLRSSDAVVVAPSSMSRGGEARILVLSRADPSTTAGREVRDRAVSVAAGRVGGGPAMDGAFVHAIYVRGAWVLVPVALFTFLLLARALRSVWLPIKALLLNALSIAAAYGATVLIWQDGVGTELLFGRAPTGVVTPWVPVAAFAFLFGLSMDYEVFILSRMRESYDRHGSTDRAVVDGIAETARLVTAGATILVFAFVALATVPTVEVKILATTLAAGIIVDALIVRTLLAPALVGLFGRLNWVDPPWLRRMVGPWARHPGQQAVNAA